MATYYVSADWFWAKAGITEAQITAHEQATNTERDYETIQGFLDSNTFATCNWSGQTSRRNVELEGNNGKIGVDVDAKATYIQVSVEVSAALQFVLAELQPEETEAILGKRVELRKVKGHESESNHVRGWMGRDSDW